jgi:hypothetical protein
MLMEEREYRGRPRKGRDTCAGREELGKSDWPVPLLSALLLWPTRWMLIFLRRPPRPPTVPPSRCALTLSCTQHCLTSSTRGAVSLATHRPPFHRRPTRRVAKTTSCQVPSAPPAQAKNSKARSGPRGEPITAGSTRSGATSPRRKAIPRVAMIGPLAGPHC